MSQIFRRSSNTIARLSLLAVFLLVVVIWAAGDAIKWSSYMTEESVPRIQPIAFSHKHHVKGDGIDCRYCHYSVEVSATAGMPSTETCMTCHSQVWSHSPLLERVRKSFLENRPIEWSRVNTLPHYVFFNHAIHVNKGVACVTCHGRVDEMPLTWKARPFYMKDCLSCHRNPGRYIRPKGEVFNLHWKPWISQEEQLRIGNRLVKEYGIDSHRITDCYTCHR